MMEYIITQTKHSISNDEHHFTINEIKQVVFEMKHNSAPGPDGFPAEFFQNFWDLIQWMFETYSRIFMLEILILKD